MVSLLQTSLALALNIEKRNAVKQGFAAWARAGAYHAARMHDPLETRHDHGPGRGMLQEVRS